MSAAMFQPEGAEEGARPKRAPPSPFAQQLRTDLTTKAFRGVIPWGAYLLTRDFIGQRVAAWRPNRHDKDWFELVQTFDAEGLPLDDADLLLACLEPQLQNSLRRAA